MYHIPGGKKFGEFTVMNILASKCLGNGVWGMDRFSQKVANNYKDGFSFTNHGRFAKFSHHMVYLDLLCSNSHATCRWYSPSG